MAKDGVAGTLSQLLSLWRERKVSDALVDFLDS